MRIRLFLAALFALTAAARARPPERVGLHPLPDGQAQLADRLAAQLHEPPPPAAMTVGEARSRAARILFASGAALLVGAAGAELYARIESHALDARYRSGSLTEADAARYAAVQRTGVLATALAATGAGALAAGGLVIALTPSGAALRGRF